jgi:hypothetical protein
MWYCDLSEPKDRKKPVSMASEEQMELDVLLEELAEFIDSEGGILNSLRSSSCAIAITMTRRS